MDKKIVDSSTAYRESDFNSNPYAPYPTVSQQYIGKDGYSKQLQTNYGSKDGFTKVSLVSGPES